MLLFTFVLFVAIGVDAAERESPQCGHETSEAGVILIAGTLQTVLRSVRSLISSDTGPHCR